MLGAEGVPVAADKRSAKIAAKAVAVSSCAKSGA
jgi:hypothetical protein